MVENKIFSKLRSFDQSRVNRTELVHGTLTFLFLSNLLYEICVKVFIVKRYINFNFKELHNDQEYY